MGALVSHMIPECAAANAGNLRKLEEGKKGLYTKTARERTPELSMMFDEDWLDQPAASISASVFFFSR
jgi:hypothetical protein